jgi:hypothetical protein
MTKASKLSHLPTVAQWLTNTVSKSSDEKYYHRHLEENLDIRADIINELQNLIHDAHKDARQPLINLTKESLDPLEEETLFPDISIIDDFPRCLGLTTLKGYFGEIMAAIVAENFNPFDEDWQVFAFPFRSHQMAYHAFEQIRQEGGSAPTIIGRFGDDMLAFQHDLQGKITHILFCEAKCTARHDRDMITDAHKKSSDSKIIPVDCKVLIEILRDYATPGSKEEKWLVALQHLYLSVKNPTHKRSDFVSYICGLPPVQIDTVIIPRETTHSSYTAQRRLEAVEIHLHDVNGLIEEIYQVITKPIICSLDELQLSTLWSKVIFYLPEKHKDLIRENCRLLSFDNQKAIVNIKTLTPFRAVQRRTDDLKNAFQKSGLFTPTESQQKVDIKLQCKTS